MNHEACSTSGGTCVPVLNRLHCSVLITLRVSVLSARICTKSGAIPQRIFEGRDGQTSRAGLGFNTRSFTSVISSMA